MISARYAREHLRSVLLGQRELRPFRVALGDSYPEVLDPGRIPAELRARFLADAERAAGSVPFEPLTATLYRSYVRQGQAAEYDRRFFARRTDLGALAMGSWIADGGAFVDPLADALWQVCEESSWLLPGHNYPPAGGPRRALPDPEDPWVDLFSSETAALLAWTVYLNEEVLDAVEPRVRERVYREVSRRVIQPYLRRSDYWWMGFERDPGVVINNWNPWCSSNVLSATLLLEPDPETRLQVVMRVLAVLDCFIEGYADDGGCDEGTMYWAAAAGALYDALELIAMATRGKCTFWDLPRIRNMMRYPTLTHIDADYVLSFADGDGKVRLPSALLYRAGMRFDDTALVGLGCAAFRESGETVRPETYYPIFRLLWSIACYDAMRKDRRGAPYRGYAWLPGVQVFVARETEGTPHGLYVAAKGGHNGESHSHNDVGSFVVYLDGQPILVDPGTETYTAQTFDKIGRWKLWTTQSSYHNLPEIGGIQQHNGAEYAATDCSCKVDADRMSLKMDISGAYPEEAGVESWLREILLERGDLPFIELADRYSLRASSSGLVWCFVACPEPMLSPGRITFAADNGATLAMTYDPEGLDAAVEKIPIRDPRMAGVWGSALYRLRLSQSRAVRCGTRVFRFLRGE